MRRAAGRLPRPRTRSAGGLLAVALAALPQGAARSAPPAPVRCTHLAVSPAFARDRTAFCAGLLDPRQPGAAFYVTTNGGRSWARSAAHGLETARAVGAVIASPLYARDRAVYVTTGDALLVSTDRGGTFTVADPLTNRVGWDVLAPFVTSAPGLPTQPVPRVAFAWAHTAHPALVDPPLHVPVAGPPGGVMQFLVPPGVEAAGDRALATMNRSVGTPTTTLQGVVWGCLPGFSCGTPLHEFAPGTIIRHAWLAPDYATSRAVYVVTEPFPDAGPVVLWRSVDGGETFAKWAPANAVLGRYGTPFGRWHVALGFHPAAPRTYYLRIAMTAQNRREPQEQLLRSTNAGATWTRVAATASPGRRSTLPWVGKPLAAVPDVVVAADGRLFTIGYTPAAEQVYCSVDGGRTWAPACPR